MMDPHQIIIRPVISEKSYNLIENQNQYTFEVDRRANKNQIKKAVEEAFDVSVEKVNTVNVKSKPKRQGFTRGRTSTWKKAVVKLAEGDRIELFEGV
ncbi:MAG: 50S ribosomal protein L23 [Rubrobacteraceae bacterium]|nr:50S ribosomal protein L23 [Rubrobacteraceae bacterium]